MAAPASSAATEDAQPQGGLSEDDAVTVALAQNPALRVLRSNQAIAKGQIVAAATIANPEMSFDVDHTQVRDKLGWEVGLKWAVPQPLEWLAKRTLSRSHLTEVNHLVADQEWILSSQVRLAHATLLELREQARLYETALQLRKQISTLVRLRVARGGATRLEQNLVELSALYAQRDLDEVTLRQTQAQNALQTLLGQPSATPLAVIGTPPPGLVEPTPIDPAPLAELALSRRPALQAERERLTQRQQAVRIEQIHRYPWLGVHGTYRENNLSNYPHDLQLGVDVTLPVFNLNTGNILIAEAQLGQERASGQALVQSLIQQVYSACAELNTRKRILLRFTQEVLPVLSEHERLMEIAAKGSQLDLVALLSNEESVLRSRRDASDARLAYRGAALALEATVGASLPEKLR